MFIDRYYYIYDVRFPKVPFMFTTGHNGEYIPAIFTNEEKAEQVCAKMNANTTLTRYEVDERPPTIWTDKEEAEQMCAYLEFNDNYED